MRLRCYKRRREFYFLRSTDIIILLGEAIVRDNICLIAQCAVIIFLYRRTLKGFIKPMLHFKKYLQAEVMEMEYHVEIKKYCFSISLKAGKIQTIILLATRLSHFYGLRFLLNQWTN